MSGLAELLKLRLAGMQPDKREIWAGLGFLPTKRNSVLLDPANLASAREYASVAGLDVLLCFQGKTTPYGQLRDVCFQLQQACPRRLVLIDQDLKRLAFLKLEGGC